jgi:hypothetical protein
MAKSVILGILAVLWIGRALRFRVRRTHSSGHRIGRFDRERYHQCESGGKEPPQPWMVTA